MALDSVAAARDLGAKGEQRGFGGSSAGSVEHLLRNDEGREEKLIDRDAGENEMDGGEGELDVGGDDLHFGVGVHLHEDVLRVSRFNRSRKRTCTASSVCWSVALLDFAADRASAPKEASHCGSERETKRTICRILRCTRS